VKFRLADTYLVPHRGREYLFVIKNAAIVELEGESAAALDALGRAGASSLEGIEEEVIRRVVDEARGDQETLEDFAGLGLFEPAGPRRPDAFVSVNRVLGGAGGPVPLQSLIAHVTQDCNLRCTYCYADHGLYGAMEKKLMAPGMIREYVDLLLRESLDQRSLNFTFFGGEPLMNFPAIEEAVRYGRERAREAGKRIRFSLTTNGTLFDEEKIRFILANDVAVTVSMDGPPEIHDAARPRAGGGGSYATAMSRLRPLLRVRPVPVRVTLTRRSIEVERIVDHLLGEGFSEVGVTPAATLHPGLRITGSDWERLGDELERAALRYQAEALAGGSYGFSNVTNLLRQYREGASRGYPCGAGAGLLAGNASGGLYACHRNVNDPRFALGGLAEGIDRRRQNEFLEKVHVKGKPDCDRCWLRSLCGGGCYHVGALLGGGVDAVPLEMCDHIRRWYLNCLRVYLTLLEERPGFLEAIAGGGAGAPATSAEVIGPHLNPFLD